MVRNRIDISEWCWFTQASRVSLLSKKNLQDPPQFQKWLGIGRDFTILPLLSSRKVPDSGYFLKAFFRLLALNWPVLMIFNEESL